MKSPPDTNAAERRVTRASLAVLRRVVGDDRQAQLLSSARNRRPARLGPSWAMHPPGSCRTELTKQASDPKEEEYFAPARWWARCAAAHSDGNSDLALRALLEEAREGVVGDAFDEVKTADGDGRNPSRPLMLVGCPLHVEHVRARLPEVLRVVARVETGRAHREQLLVGRERDVQGKRILN